MDRPFDPSAWTTLAGVNRSLFAARVRRGAALTVTLVAAAGDAGAGTAADPAYHQFWSRPDLHPPVVRVLHAADHTAPGYLFIAPKRQAPQVGPMIFDNRGRLVWFRPLKTRGITDFRVQRYQDRPVLTWWQARPTGARDGRSLYTIVDSSYRRIRIVRPGNGLVGDIHEFVLTPRGTALMTTFRSVRVGARRISEGGFQELELRTGRVLFDWHSIDHVSPAESYSKPPKKGSVSFDYFHINSIDVDRDGNFIVSARNTHTVYKISRRTGKILWRLGGKRSDFALGPHVRFAWQHDARRFAGLLRVFDNGAVPKVHPQSRVIYLRLDRGRMRAQLVRSIVHRPPLVAINQGNAQSLPNGHLLVGWGHEPYVTEYDARGRIVLDLRFGGRTDSYRAYRFRWVGHPITRPAIAIHGRRVFVSWNGATEVTRWQLLAGGSPSQLKPVRTVPRRDFETSAPLPRGTWLAFRALDRAGRSLGRSRAIRSG
jgi:hypothetical protein